MTEMGAMFRGRPRTCCDHAKTKKDAAVILLTKRSATATARRSRSARHFPKASRPRWFWRHLTATSWRRGW